jgi:class 3 adenylate cyclase
VQPPPPAVRAQQQPSASGENASDLVSGSYAEVTALFADIVEFTKFCEGASAEVLGGVLHHISTRFDAVADSATLDKIKIIGDAYLAAMGLADPLANHTIRASRMALDMVEAVDRFNEHSRYKLKVRIGIETPAAAASGTGKRKRLYDL